MLDLQYSWLSVLSFGMAVLACACFTVFAEALSKQPAGGGSGELLAGGSAVAIGLWSAALVARLAFPASAPTLREAEAALFCVLPAIGGVIAALHLAAAHGAYRRILGAAGAFAAVVLLTPLTAALTSAAGVSWLRSPDGFALAGALAFVFIVPAMALLPPAVSRLRSAAATLLLAAAALVPSLLHPAQWPVMEAAEPEGAGGLVWPIALDAFGAIGLLLLIRRLFERDTTALAVQRAELHALDAGFAARLQKLADEKQSIVRESERRREQLMHSANVGFFDWDLPSGEVRYGGAWVSMLGYAPEQGEQLRQSIDPWLRLCHASDLRQAQRLLRELFAGERERVRCELRLRSARETWHWVLVNAQTVEWRADGSPQRVLGTQVDINHIKRTERTLLSERSLFASGPVIILTFEADPPHRLRQASSNLQEARGDPDQPLPAGQALDALLHPDDAAGLAESARLALSQPGAKAQREVRVTKADGTWPWYLLHVVADRPTVGSLLRAYLVDINRLKEAESHAAAHNEALQEVVRKMAETQHFMETLQQLTELLQLCENEAESQQIIVQGGPQLFPRWSGALTFAGSEGLMEVAASWGEPFTPERSEEADCWAVRRGRLHQYSADRASHVLSPVCGHFGGGPTLPPGIKHAICAPLLKSFDRPGVLHLIAHATMGDEDLRTAAWGAETLADALKLSLANLRLRTSLREQAVRDGMTDLYNRRYFDEVLSRETSRSQRAGDGLILAIIDIDHFKSFNDTFGHEAGDQVLKKVAEQLRGFVRAYDIACRVGGEELAIIMPRVHIDEACARLNQLREEISACALTHNGVQLPPINVSIGVAELDAGTPEDLLRRADTALYAAKHGGRNRVKRWEVDLDGHPE